MSEKFRESNEVPAQRSQHEIKLKQPEHHRDTQAEAIELKKARHELDETYKTDKLEKSAHSATKILGVSLPNPVPIVHSLSKTLTTIRQRLSPGERVFSKLTHNPVVENVSDFTAKTLARPFAILAGGAVSVIGSAAYLYYTRHFGYEYNYFVPILLFAAGLAAGFTTELLYKTLTLGRKR